MLLPVLPLLLIPQLEGLAHLPRDLWDGALLLGSLR